MELDDLIAKAKPHVASINPVHGPRLCADDFPRVKVREAAMVCFESDGRPDRVFVFLDRTSGDYITIMYSGGGRVNIQRQA